MTNTKHKHTLTEVVKCKDCIHSEIDGDKRVCPYWMGYDMASQGEWVTVRDDDFCSFGSNGE